MATAIALTSNQTRSMVSRYTKGETVRDLAGFFDISTTSVLRILRDNNVKIRPRGRRSNA
jgi:Mor family transcriptional regulator